ncbi:MAG: Fic family protein [Rhizobiales bacterium]|nr:Fic family protein [Hyphomicrobiales bacterium]
MVDSAISRPYCGYYRRIYEKSAALMHSMAANHGFADGNKRTTIILMHLLLARSGYKLVPIAGDPPLDSAVEELVLGVVRHDVSLQELKVWFAERIQRK